LVMRDDDELRRLREFAHHVAKATDVGLVERGVDLVEEAKGARLDQENPENQANGGQGFLTAREQLEALDLLAWRLRHDLDPGVQEVVGLGHHQLGTATIEEAREELLEHVVDGVEGLFEANLRRLVDAIDRLLKRADRRLEIVALAREVLVALADLFEL